MAPKLFNVIRLDSLPLGQTYFTPEGYLKDRPVLTTTGIFEYGNPDGSVRRELRLPEDVFNPESLASYKGKPIIITHDAGLVTKDNVQENQIGTILTEGYRSNDDVRAEIIIHNTDEMKECGLKELSLGYSLDLDETPGEWNGQHYDAIQRNIRINHLALVREARAGEQARLNIDGRDTGRTLKGGKIMKNTPKKTRRTDGVLSPEELAKAIEEYKARRANAAEPAAAQDGEGEPAAEEKKVVSAPPASPVAEDGNPVVAPAGEEPTSVEKKADMVKEHCADDGGLGGEDVKVLFDIIDTLLAQKAFDEAGEGEAKPAAEPAVPAEGEGGTAEDGCGNKDEDDDAIPSSDPTDAKPSEVMNADSVDAIIRQRIQLGIVGRALNLDSLETMGISDAKKAVIKAVRPSVRLDGKSDSYVSAMYEFAVAEVKDNSKKDTGFQKKQMFNKDSKVDEPTGPSSLDARQAMIDRQMNKNKEEK